MAAAASFALQPMMFYLTADRGKQRIVGARLNQRLAKSTMRGLVMTRCPVNQGPVNQGHVNQAL